MVVFSLLISLLTILLIIAMFLLVASPVLWQNTVEYFDISSVDIINFTNIAPHFWNIVRYVITGTILFFVVCSTYYILPNISQKMRLVVPGAILVVIIWIIFGQLFALYLSSFNQLNLIYGSLGGIMISLLFFYVLSAILIFGAEFNYKLNFLLHDLDIHKKSK